MSARRRRGGDEFADERSRLAEDQPDAAPWQEEPAGPWASEPARPREGRRGRHSAAGADEGRGLDAGGPDDTARPGGGWRPDAGLSRQAGPWERRVSGPIPAQESRHTRPEPPEAWRREPPEAPRREPPEASRTEPPVAPRREPHPGRGARYSRPPDPHSGPGAYSGPDEGYVAGDRYSGPPRGQRPAGRDRGQELPGRTRPSGRYPGQDAGYGRPPRRYPDSSGGAAADGYGDPPGDHRDPREFGGAARRGYADPRGGYGDQPGARGGGASPYGGPPGERPGGGPGRGPAAGGRPEQGGAPYPARGRGHDDPARYRETGRPPAPGGGYGGQVAPEQAGRAGSLLPGMDTGRPPAGDRGRREPGRRPGRGGSATGAGRGGYPAEDWDSGGGEGPRPRRRRRGRWAGPSAVLVIAAIILVPLAVGGVYAYRVISAHFNPPNYSGDGTGRVVFQVKPGDDAATVGDRLVADGVVASSRALVLAAEHSSNPNGLQPGFYRLHEHMDAALAWKLLVSPAARVQIKVTVPEGLRVPQILATLAHGSGIPASDYTKAARNTAALGLPSYARGNPEGYLYPATYEIQPDMTAISVLKAMVNAFNQEAASVSLPQAAARMHLTPAQVIVVASLAQAEGGKVSDFPKITRVIYNRLAAGMRLQLDSTVLYAVHKYGILASNQQLNVDSPYNTYRNKGLPPGPIDSPGNAAIQAALHPARGTWLYFVTVNPKTKQTVFTNSATVFGQLRNELQRNLANGG